MQRKNVLFLLFLLPSYYLLAQVSFTKLDIATGSGSANPRKFVIYNNQLYFTAFGTNVSGIGDELYVTNGTQAGTQLVSNINPTFSASSTPENLTVFNNELYFSAFTNSNGRELYKTNGTTVTLIKDIAEGANDGLESTTFIELNGHLYFFAQDTASTGYDLWRTDGTTNGTIKVINLNSNGVAGNRLYFTKYNNELYFLAQNINDITVGIELYKYNPTTNAVNLVVDLYPTNGQSSSIGYSNFTVFDNKLFFIADGRLRYTDGTTTVAVTTGATNLTAYFKPKVLQNQLLFIANSTNNGSQDVYKCVFDNVTSDYKIELVYNFNQTANLPIASSINNDGFDIFTELNGNLYFAAREASSPNSGAVFQIYETNGVNTRVAVPITYTGSPTSRAINFIIAHAGKLYYQSVGTGSPEQLWEANPTTGSFTQLTNFTPQNNIPEQVFGRPMVVFNTELYFEAQKSGDGYELWKLNNPLLPSICKSFTGNISGENVELSWIVSNQINTKNFVVERSINATDFKEIATIEAAGNSIAEVNYKYIDNLNVQQLVYYRIKQVDKDGSYMYLCSTIQIKNKLPNKAFTMYPNAANNVLYIKVEPLYVGAYIKIMGLNGKVVVHQKISSTTQQVNTSSLSNGTYLIAITKNESVYYQKLIIQH